MELSLNESSFCLQPATERGCNGIVSFHSLMLNVCDFPIECFISVANFSLSFPSSRVHFVQIKLNCFYDMDLSFD